MNWNINLNHAILLFMMGIMYSTFAGVNPDNPYCTHEAPCWEPVDDATFGGNCCIPNDHVVNACITRYEAQVGGGWCISDVNVGEWAETSLGGGMSLDCIISWTWFNRTRVITCTQDGYENITCITESLECEDGSEKTVNDWPGSYVRKEVVSQFSFELLQSQDFKRGYRLGCLRPPSTFEVPDPPAVPPNNSPCDYSEGTPCDPCPSN